MANIIEIVIKAKDEASAKVKGMGEKIKGSVSKLITLPHLIMAAGVTKAISSVIKAYGKQEEAVAKLNAVLRVQGIESEEVTKKITGQAAALQKLTKFGDEQIIAAQAMLLQLGVMPKDLERTTKATLDWATAMGKDVVTSAIDLGKAAGGNLMMLQRYGIQLEKTTFEAEGMDYVLGELEKKFGGQAEAVAKKGTGPLVQFGNIIGDVSEKIGAALIPGIIEIIEAIKPILPLVEKLSVGIATAISLAVTSLVSGTKILVAIWNRDWEKLVEISKESSKKMKKTAIDAFDVIIEKSDEMTMGISDGWEWSVGVHKKSEKKKVEDTEETNEKLLEMEAELRDELLQMKLSESEYDKVKLEEKVEALEQAGVDEILIEEWKQERLAELRGDAFDASKTRYEEQLEIVKSVSDSMESSFSSGLSSMIKEEKSFSEFHKSLWSDLKSTAIDAIADIVAKEIWSGITTKAVETTKAQSKTVAAHADIPFVGLAIGIASAALFATAIAKFQEGGIVKKPTLGIVGEAGPEAVIPLDKMGKFGEGVKIENIIIQFPNVTSFQDWRDADPSLLKEITEMKIYEAMETLTAEGKPVPGL